MCSKAYYICLIVAGLFLKRSEVQKVHLGYIKLTIDFSQKSSKHLYYFLESKMLLFSLVHSGGRGHRHLAHQIVTVSLTSPLSKLISRCTDVC